MLLHMVYFQPALEVFEACFFMGKGEEALRVPEDFPRKLLN
jgi:hypothetical protein